MDWWKGMKMRSIRLQGEGEYVDRLHGMGWRGAGKSKEVRDRREGGVRSSPSGSNYRRRKPGEQKRKGEKK